MAKPLSPSDLEGITSITLQHYDTYADQFWEGTKDHDVAQNIAALLEALPKKKSLRILDFGCGPGRDLLRFKKLGHSPTGLDGSSEFCKMASELSGCPVLHQNFLSLSLPPESFDGVFANASLFHIPKQELPRVLGELRTALVSEGVLFSSNPRGAGEGWSAGRYGSYYQWENYYPILESAGFKPITHYFRPAGLPFAEQNWLAIVSRKI